MDVVQFYTENDDTFVSVVEPEIRTFLKLRRNNEASLYINFTKDCDRLPMFGVCTLTTSDIYKESVDTVEDCFQSFGHPELDRQMSRTKPRRGDFIEFNFQYKEKAVLMGIRFVYYERFLQEGWSSPVFASKPLPEQFRLTIVTAKTNFVCLDDVGFGEFDLNRGLNPTDRDFEIGHRFLFRCSICMENANTVDKKKVRLRMVAFTCGHLFCEHCTKNTNNCWICHNGAPKTAVRFRDGPCPLDECRHEDANNTNCFFVLLPCCCAIFPRNARERSVPFCPFNTCGRAVEDRMKLYVDRDHEKD